VRLIGIGDRVTRQAGVVIHEIIHIPVTQGVGEDVLPRVEVLLPAGGDPLLNEMLQAGAKKLAVNPQVFMAFQGACQRVRNTTKSRAG